MNNSLFCKKNKPKSIAVKANCTINREKTKKDWKNGTPKLYLNSGTLPIENSRKDKIFQKKYNIKYVEIGYEAAIYECIIDYNFYIIKNLDIQFDRKWRKTKRKEIVGMSDYLNSIKACIN